MKKHNLIWKFLKKINNSKGFSIPEVYITITIISLLSSTSIPTMSGYADRTRLKTITNKFTTQIMEVKIKAISQNQAYRISFISDHEYIISADANGNSIFESNEIVSSNNLQDFCKSISVSMDTDLIFYPRGITSNSIITITNKKYSKKITVNLSGQIQVELI